MDKFNTGDVVCVKGTGDIMIVFGPDRQRKHHYICGKAPVIQSTSCSYYVDELNLANETQLILQNQRDFDGDVFNIIGGITMHTFETETVRIVHNSDLSGTITVYDKRNDNILEIPGNDIVELVLGRSRNMIMSATEELQRLIQQTKRYQGFCGYCGNQPCSCNRESLNGARVTLKDLIPLIDDEYYVEIYSGDTAVTGLILEGRDILRKEAQAYYDNEVSSINLGINNKTNESYFYILLE